MGYFHLSVNLSNLVECIEIWRKSTMEAEYLVFYNSCKREHIKQIGIVFPYVSIPVFPETLIVESIDLGDLSRLVVPS